MLIELPLWALILITVGSFLISFIIVKMMGSKILYAIAIAFILPLILLFILHTFDVKDGQVTPHIGDFFTAIFIATAILYYIFLVLYVVVYTTIKDKCCKRDDIMDKIKLAYETENYEKLDNPGPDDTDFNETRISLPIDIPPPSSPVVSGKFYDSRSNVGSLK